MSVLDSLVTWTREGDNYVLRVPYATAKVELHVNAKHFDSLEQKDRRRVLFDLTKQAAVYILDNWKAQ